MLAVIENGYNCYNHGRQLKQVLIIIFAYNKNSN